jgi:two-component system response regulator HydG
MPKGMGLNEQVRALLGPTARDFLRPVKSRRVLVVEADPRAGATLCAQLRELGFEPAESATGQGALALATTFRPEVTLLDVAAPGCDGAPIVQRLRNLGGQTAVVVMGDAGEGSAALLALAAGADGYLTRPLDRDRVLAALERASERHELRAEITGLRERLRGRLALIGASPDLAAVFELVRRVAPTKATVLIHGETGSGKHHLAQVVHELSPRRERPFVAVNCAALSETLIDSELFGHEQGAFEGADGRRIGRVEQARGGTLYLQEVAHLPPAIQVRLLRVLQEGIFERLGGREPLASDVRVVAGSSRDLADEVRHGRFRDDLYYRLNVVSASLPALRDRKADIPALVTHLLAERPRAGGTPPLQAAPGVLSAFFAYPWPGNLRELAAAVEVAASRASGAELRAEDLPAVMASGLAEKGSGSGLIPGATLFEIEREAILRTLEQAAGSTTRAAEVLGVSVRKIQYRLKEYRAGQPGHHHTAARDAFGGDSNQR